MRGLGQAQLVARVQPARGPDAAQPNAALILTPCPPCGAQVYKGVEHPHDAQSPEPLTFGGLTAMPDTQLLEFVDPDAIKCA
jgi:hypothetical protein